MPVVNDSQLTDLPTLKSWLKISDVANDANLTRLIIAVSRLFKELVNRPVFIATDITETLRGSGSAVFSLSTLPVQNVYSVLGNNIILSPYVLNFTSGYEFEANGLFSRFSNWDRNTMYTISYNGGYPLDSQEAAAAEQAVISICALWWTRRNHPDQASQALGNQITSNFIQAEIPPEAAVIIRAFKRVC